VIVDGPGSPLGTVALSDVPDTIVTVAEASEPNFTSTPAKPEPVTVTVLPVIPELGVNELIVGAPYAYRSFDDFLLVPPGVVTVMSTLPAALAAGAVTVSDLLETIATFVPGVDPNVTVAARTQRRSRRQQASRSTASRAMPCWRCSDAKPEPVFR
jgi:hypothetical protein